jgi:hypothetical protein
MIGVANADLLAASEPPAPDPKRYQIMGRTVGFEQQQQAYLAKIQGSASRNIIWVDPGHYPQTPPRSLLTTVSGWFHHSPKGDEANSPKAMDSSARK